MRFHRVDTSDHRQLLFFAERVALEGLCLLNQGDAICVLAVHVLYLGSAQQAFERRIEILLLERDMRTCFTIQPVRCLSNPGEIASDEPLSQQVKAPAEHRMVLAKGVEERLLDLAHLPDLPSTYVRSIREQSTDLSHLMCRLYGFRATEPTKVECTLVHAQNALMAQSRADLTGTSHAHGWGVAAYENRHPHIERRAWAAYHGEHFARAAARVYSGTVLAHVRRATVGSPGLSNTHPFTHEHWAFAHNGTVPHFDRVRSVLIDRMDPRHREAIGGETDSEHMFRYAMSLIDGAAGNSLVDVLRRIVKEIVDCCQLIDPEARIGLNLLITDGICLAGTRLGRTLYYVERDGIYDCEICGFPHIHHDPKRDYAALVVASEPITHEAWHEIPESSVWEVDATAELTIEPLGLDHDIAVDH